jgi:hypothetical protein
MREKGWRLRVLSKMMTRIGVWSLILARCDGCMKGAWYGDPEDQGQIALLF